MAKILIVEDDGLIAADLADTVSEHTGAETIVVPSLAEAEPLTEAGLDFAVLDINVLGGNTYELARRLRALGVPFAFASGSRRNDLPADLQSCLFLAKPCRLADITEALDAAMPAAMRLGGKRNGA